MNQNIAILVAIGVVLMAAGNIEAQGQTPPARPAPVTYNYEQHSWPQSATTHEWEGYVPAGYHPAPDNAFDAAPVHAAPVCARAYPGPYAVGCAPGLGLSVGFGIGGCSVGIGPCGISAGIGLGCSPIGVWCGTGCY